MQHKTIKPAAAFGTLHFCEYSMFVQAIDSAAGRKTLDGVPLENSSLTVNKKGGEQTGHRIRAKMVGSSMGPKQRIAEFTVDYKNGFINTHEEVFTLGVGSGVIEKPTSMSYVFGDRKWVGSSNIMEALRTDPELCEAVLVEVKKRDLAGTFSGVSESEETVEETETEVE
jgi:recombination protein RecA